MCNLPNCKEKITICKKCLEDDGVERYGHPKRHLVPSSVKDHDPDVTVRHVITHGHFALYKGTKSPAIDTGRNLRCLIEKKRVDKKKNTRTRTVLIDNDDKPWWLIEELEE